MDVRSLNLSWLPEPQSNFREQLRDLQNSSPAAFSDARRLATACLNVSQLHHMGKVLAALQAQEDEIRLGVLSNGTTDLIYSAISVSALRYGLRVRVIGADFNQVAAQAFDPESTVHKARCHFVLLNIDHRGLPFEPAPGNIAHARASLEEALSYMDSLRRSLVDRSGCTVILQTVAAVPERLFGSIEQSTPGTLSWLIQHYNDEIRARAQQSSVLLLDVAALAADIGLWQWHDPAQWALGKFSFAHVVIPLYAEWLARLLSAARGKSRKCLVVDLDNTIWGGVVGDDGVAGLVLGNGSPEGEAYASVQKAILSLRSRGILLAVSSKNDDEIARRPFREHPEMLLKEEHFSVFQANWLDKPANLRAIARELNFALEALVLLDDNPAERALVRSLLPEVGVPELPSDPALYARTLLAAGYFESIGFTADDVSRADQYTAESSRKALLGTASNLNDHLRSLRMQATFAPFDAIGRPRIAQLINKTNQFNLTTRRYTEAEIEALKSSPTAFTLQIRLQDRFGDHGMIVCIICTMSCSEWDIDTWLMSCRVLNRNVEDAILIYVAGCAKNAGARVLSGHYHRTERNSIVQDLYGRLGFRAIRVEQSESHWQLDLTSYAPAPVPIHMVSLRQGIVDLR